MKVEYLGHVEENCPTSLLATKYMLKINKRNTRRKCEVCLKITIKTLERSH